MTAPASDHIVNDLHIPHGIHLQLVLSVFLLTYSFGLFVLSPCSEIWGRKQVIHFGNLIFVLFNAACGFPKTKNETIAFRFIAGLGGSATLDVSLTCSLRGTERLLTISPGWCRHSFLLLECRGARPRNDYLPTRSGPRTCDWPNW